MMTQPSQPATKWSAVWLAIAAGVVAALFVGKVPPALPVLRHELGLSLITAGWLASLITVLGALGGILVGLLTDRICGPRLLVWGVAILALGAALGAMSSGAVELLAARFLEALGLVFTAVSAPSVIIAGTSPADRGMAFGIWGAYLPAGAGFAMVTTPWILEAFDWRAVWWVSSGCAAAMALALMLGLSGRAWPERPGPRPSRSWSDIRSTLALPGPWLYGLCFAFYAALYFVIATWIPTFLIETQGRSLGEAATVGAGVTAINVGGNLLAGWLMHRGEPRWRLMIVAFLAIMGASWFVFADGAPDEFRIPAAFFYSLFGGLLPAAALAGAPGHARNPAEVSTCNGIVVQCSNTGSLVGAPIMAMLVVALGGWEHGYWMMICFGAVGIALALVLRRIEIR